MVTGPYAQGLMTGIMQVTICVVIKSCMWPIVTRQVPSTELYQAAWAQVTKA